MEPQTQMQCVDDHLGGSGSLLDTNVGFCCLIPTMAAVWVTLSQRDQTYGACLTPGSRPTRTRNIYVILISDFAWIEGSSHPQLSFDLLYLITFEGSRDL